MGAEKFIHNQEYDPEIGSHSHPGQHSMRTRVESAIAKLSAWRQERTQSHESGEDAPELCYPGEVGHFPQELEEGGLVGIGGEYPESVDSEWLDEVARHNEIYNQSVSTQEDPRLRDD